MIPKVNPDKVYWIKSYEITEINLCLYIVPESCYGSVQNSKCPSKNVTEITKDMLTPPILAATREFDMPANENDAQNNDELPERYRKDPKVFAQNQRLFKYLINLKYPSEEEFQKETKNKLAEWAAPTDPDLKGKLNNPPRIVKMLEMSFLIVQTHVDDRFVPRDFKRDIQNAFIFLVQETYQSGIIQDISEDDYIKIMTSLAQCASHKNPFELVGTRCRTWSEVSRLH